MKIRDRLALIFTQSAAIILLVLSLLLYFSSSYFRKNDFYNQLNKRAELIHELFQRDAEIANKGEFLTLPEEMISIVPVNKDRRAIKASLQKDFPDSFIKSLLDNNYSEYKRGAQEGIGRIFTINGKSLLVIVAATDAHGKAQLKNLRNILIVGFIFSIALFYLIGRLSSGLVLKPIANKIQKARRIGASNLHLRLNINNENDEMGQLAVTFNEMLDRLQTAFEMQRNFISNASHEIRNPLTAIIGETEVCLEKKRSSEEYIDSLTNISKEADRLDALVTSLLSLAKTGFDETKLRKEDVRLDEVLLEAKININISNPQNKITLDFSDLPDDQGLISLHGNPNLLRIALTNLMENACKFSHNQKVDVRLLRPANGAQIRIEDKGVGIPEYELKKILQPFYRAENARSFKGFGIGLALTDKIIKLHEGEMEVISEEGRGTCILISF